VQKAVEKAAANNKQKSECSTANLQQAGIGDKSPVRALTDVRAPPVRDRDAPFAAGRPRLRAGSGLAPRACLSRKK
jgi:hypothetical protein